LLSVHGIGLSDRLEDSPLRCAVQTHECVHHLLGLSTTALCHTSWYPVRDELLAWMGAGRLVVSCQQEQDVRRGGVSPAELAEESGTPPLLIGLGLAVHAYLRGEGTLLSPVLAAWCLEIEVHLTLTGAELDDDDVVMVAATVEHVAKQSQETHAPPT
jgi:hypothetical protein